MGQSEVVQALINLGGSADLQDLTKEYIKLLYPPQFYGEDYVKEASTKYLAYKVMGRYLCALKKTHTIKTEKMDKTDKEYEQERLWRIKEQGTSNGLFRKKILVSLIG